MPERKILLKIKREFTENEAVVLLQQRISELEIEIGKLKSELAENADRLKKYENGEGKTAKEWLRDDYIAELITTIRGQEKTIKETKMLVESWRSNYVNLLNNRNQSDEKETV